MCTLNNLYGSAQRTGRIDMVDLCIKKLCCKIDQNVFLKALLCETKAVFLERKLENR